MNTLIKICKYIFIGLTLLVAIPAVTAFIHPPDELSIAIVWIVLFVSCVGVIASWKPQAKT